MIEAKIVPLDLLSIAELKHLIGKSAEGLTPYQINAIAAGLARQQDKEGLRHEKAQAWEQGVADHKMVMAYPWIEAHLICPYDIPEDERSDDETDA